MLILALPPHLQKSKRRIKTPPCGRVLDIVKALVPLPHVMRDHPSASQLSGQHGVRDIGGIWKGERDEVRPCGRQVEGVASGQKGRPRWRAVTVGLFVCVRACVCMCVSESAGNKLCRINGKMSLGNRETSHDCRERARAYAVPPNYHACTYIMARELDASGSQRI